MKTVFNWSNQNMQIKNDNGVEIKLGTHGYTPVELLTGSLGLCIFITISKMFERDRVNENVSDFSVTVEAEKAEEGPSRIECFSVAIQMPEQLDDSYRLRLIQSAERACTIGNTIKQGAEIRFSEKGSVE